MMILDSRECIEEAIIHFNPDITDQELLDLREKIYLEVQSKTQFSGVKTYFRDYHLRSRNKLVL